MKFYETAIMKKIDQFEQDQKGLFTTADLYSLINAGNPITNQRIIFKFVQRGILTKIKRGYYVSSRYDPFMVASRLVPESYISMDTVLAKNGIVASINPQTISCITKRKRPERFKAPKTSFNYQTIGHDLYFGFTALDGGINMADNEKAYLDLLYFYMKGKKYSFDPKNEVRINKLNKPKILNYLKKYKNLKFKTFVKGLLNG